jgi:hypothetical protein
VSAASAITSTTALSEKTSEPTQRQLSILSQSPGLASATVVIEVSDTVSNNAQPNALTLSNTPGNRAQRENEISADFDLQNIIQSSCIRRSVYVTALKQTDKLVEYYSSFYTAKKTISTKLPYQDILSASPKSWKQMLKHRYSAEFKKAADKEFNSLRNKRTFKFVSKSQINKDNILLLLM